MSYKNDDSAVRRNDDHDDHDGHDDHDDHDEHYEHEDRDDHDDLDGHVCVCMHGRFFGENRCARVLVTDLIKHPPLPRCNVGGRPHSRFFSFLQFPARIAGIQLNIEIGGRGVLN